MNPKKKRRSRVVEVGKGPAKVRIYTITRKDGYPQFTLNWKEGGRRRTRCLACMDEARMIAQQTSVRLINAWHATDEATRRDIEVLRHCEGLAGQFSVRHRNRSSMRSTSWSKPAAMRAASLVTRAPSMT